MSADLARLLERIEEHGARVTVRGGELLVENENRLPPNIAFQLQAKREELLKHTNSTNSIHPTNSTNSTNSAVTGRKSERGEWGVNGDSLTHSPQKPLKDKAFLGIGERSERSERTLRGNAKKGQIEPEAGRNYPIEAHESEWPRVNVHPEAHSPHSPKPCRYFVCPACGEHAASKDSEAIDCTCGQPMRLAEMEPAPSGPDGVQT